MSDRCTARTFDGYDADECGKPAGFAGMCSEHFKQRLEAVESELKEAEEKVDRLRTELARLRTFTMTAEEFLKGTVTSRVELKLKILDWVLEEQLAGRAPTSVEVGREFGMTTEQAEFLFLELQRAGEF